MNYYSLRHYVSAIDLIFIRYFYELGYMCGIMRRAFSAPLASLVFRFDMFIMLDIFNNNIIVSF